MSACCCMARSRFNWDPSSLSGSGKSLSSLQIPVASFLHEVYTEVLTCKTNIWIFSDMQSQRSLGYNSGDVHWAHWRCHEKSLWSQQPANLQMLWNDLRCSNNFQANVQASWGQSQCPSHIPNMAPEEHHWLDDISHASPLSEQICLINGVSTPTLGQDLLNFLHTCFFLSRVPWSSDVFGFATPKSTQLDWSFQHRQ